MLLIFLLLSHVKVVLQNQLQNKNTTCALSHKQQIIAGNLLYIALITLLKENKLYKSNEQPPTISSSAGQMSHQQV